MSKTAVIICPGRGTYNQSELGYLRRQHADKIEWLSKFDQQRRELDQPTVTELDSANVFSASHYSRGDVASPLIYTCSLADSLSIDPSIDIVAVTGNSMGWYSALAVAGALSHRHGFKVVNAMGSLMHEHGVGGQLVYPFVGENWVNDVSNKHRLLDMVQEINDAREHLLALSIDLGGMLVLAGNEQGLAAFADRVPRLQARFPMRLVNHAAFHTALQAPVAALGQDQLSVDLFKLATHPLIDGRGQVWWPKEHTKDELWAYTLGTQVTEAYNFTLAVQTAAREFAPDYFIVTGPGNTLGAAVAQSLILCEWQGVRSKADFMAMQETQPCLVSMGLEQQRSLVLS